MPRLSRPLVVSGTLLLILAGATGSVPAPSRGARPQVPAQAQALADEAVARASLAFRPDGDSGFVARSPGYGVAVSAEGATVSGAGGPPLRLRLDGARPDAPAAGRHPLPGSVNLFLGDDPSQWQSSVATFGQAAFTGVWDGIDVVWHGRGPHLEHDFVVAPGADPGRIAVSFPDGRDLAVTDAGELVVQLPGGRARLGAPTLYQDVDGRRQEVDGAFVLHGTSQVGFRVGSHDPTRPLVIDPVLLESTFIGGGGNDAAYGVAVDGEGGVYLTGSTESPDFTLSAPLQPGLAQGSGLRSDAFVVKVRPDGTGFAYSTFLGGNSRDIGYAIALAGDGSVFVTGSTESTDFPMARPVQKDYGGGGTDAFVTKISPLGAVLQYSTFLGGAGADDARGVAVDLSGSAHVTGTTTSNNFPTAGPPLQGTPSKPDDTAAFVTKLDPPGAALVYSTYLGGTGDDHGMAIAVSNTGDAFVVGDTRSPDFPVSRGFQPRPGTPPGPGTIIADAFVVKLPPSGVSLSYATYLGGFESDQATGVAVDATGSAYVTGSTGSSNFPLVKAVQINKRGDFDAFVSKINPGGSALVYSTFLGGSDSDGGAGITVAEDGSASITGTAASGDFPTVTPFQATKGGGFIDGFVATYAPTGAAVTSATYLGGREDDQGTAIATNGSGRLWVAGYTGSPDFPVARPLQPTRGGTGDAFVGTVGEPPPGTAGEAPAATGRELRLRVFGAVTALLFLAAITQTLWLRRRRAPDADESAQAPTPVPVPVGARADAGADRWYAPKPPRLSELPPLRPRAVPEPPDSRPDRPFDPEPFASGDVAVPDLLPADDGEEWKGARVPADTELWPTDEDEWSDAVTGRTPVDVQAPDLWGPQPPEESGSLEPRPPERSGGPERPPERTGAPTVGVDDLVDPEPTAGDAPAFAVDVRAPDLWAATEADGEDLAGDPMWAELLAAEAAPAPEPGAPARRPADKPPAAKAPGTKPPAAKAPGTKPPAAEPGADGSPPAAKPATTADEPAAEAPVPTSQSRRKGKTAKPEPSGQEVAAAQTVPDAAPPDADPAEAEVAVPATPTEPAPEPPSPPARRRRRKEQEKAADEPAAVGAEPSAPDEDWMAALWPAQVDEAEEPGAEATTPVVPKKKRAAAPAGETPASEPDHPGSPVPPAAEEAGPARPGVREAAEPQPAPRGWLARRRAAAAQKDRETTPTVAADAAATGSDVPTADEAPSLTPAPTLTPERPTPDPSAAPPPPTPAPSAPPRRAARPAPEAPASPPAPTAPASPPTQPPPSPRPPARRPPRRPSVTELPPPTPGPEAEPEPAAPATATGQPRFLPPAGDPFAPSDAGTPTLPPVADPPAGGADWETVAAEPAPRRPKAARRPSSDEAPPATLEDRRAVEAGLADLVADVESALPAAGDPWMVRDLPDPDVPGGDPAAADPLVAEPSISDLLAEDLPIPDAADAEAELSIRELLAEDLVLPEASRTDNDDDPGAGSGRDDPTPPAYPPLPEAAPARWRSLRPRRGPKD